MKFGAEAYTWFMKESGAAHANRLDHMIQISAKAGFTGIEPIYSWMGDLSSADCLADSLQAAGIELAAIAFGQSWNALEETEEERREADGAIALCARFPGTLLCTVQLPEGRHDLEQRRLNLVANINAVSRRVAEAGVPASFHPNSPKTSTNRT
jgi:inosose dehydratase